MNKNFKDMSADELDAEILRVRKDYLKLKMQKAIGQLGQTHLLGGCRKDIARIKTLLKQKGKTV